MTVTNLSSIKFNRQEFAGAFGDIGTDLPLIFAMILAAGLHAPSVFVVFGVLQIMTGLIYKMPMPVQPLKAMATLIISQKIAGNVVFGAGLAIGFIMLCLSVFGLLDKMSKLIPKAVIRGLQLGLGISLCLLACKEYIPSERWGGYVLASISFLVILVLLDNKKFPGALAVIFLGFIYVFIFKLDVGSISNSFGIQFPLFHLPKMEDIAKGFVLLALPQIPLSLGNSILATKQVSADLFPERLDISVKKIGITYSLMNLISPLMSGIPWCHGAGGMVGHYTFGGRTGGSVILYGCMYLIMGLSFGNGIESIIQVFPLPVLGVVLVFEGLALISFVKDIVSEGRNFSIALIVAVISVGLPYGFLLAMIIGTSLYYSSLKFVVLSRIGEKENIDE